MTTKCDGCGREFEHPDNVVLEGFHYLADAAAGGTLTLCGHCYENRVTNPIPTTP